MVRTAGRLEALRYSRLETCATTLSTALSYRASRQPLLAKWGRCAACCLDGLPVGARGRDARWGSRDGCPTTVAISRCHNYHRPGALGGGVGTVGVAPGAAGGAPG